MQVQKFKIYLHTHLQTEPCIYINVIEVFVFLLIPLLFDYVTFFFFTFHFPYSTGSLCRSEMEENMYTFSSLASHFG